MIICLETATSICSVALCDKDRVIALRESNESKSHASMLTLFINELLKEYGIRTSDLEAIAVSKGPGSYTGLRIGISVAKGIAYGASIPLIGIETTLSMFHGIMSSRELIPFLEKTTLFCPMIDARRMEVYCIIYNFAGNTIKDLSAVIISEDSFNDIPDSQKIVFFGDGAMKCKSAIRRNNSYFIDDFRISAPYMRKPAMEALRMKHFEDIAYFEPFYLKDFITSKPSKNILGEKLPS